MHKRIERIGQPVGAAGQNDPALQIIPRRRRLLGCFPAEIRHVRFSFDIRRRLDRHQQSQCFNPADLLRPDVLAVLDGPALADDRLFLVDRFPRVEKNVEGFVAVAVNARSVAS